MIVDIDTPDLELKTKIIKSRIMDIQDQFSENFNISDEVINFIANESKTKYKRINGFLIELLHLAEYTKKP